MNVSSHWTQQRAGWLKSNCPQSSSRSLAPWMCIRAPHDIDLPNRALIVVPTNQCATVRAGGDSLGARCANVIEQSLLHMQVGQMSFSESCASIPCSLALVLLPFLRTSGADGHHIWRRHPN